MSPRTRRLAVSTAVILALALTSCSIALPTPSTSPSDAPTSAPPQPPGFSIIETGVCLAEATDGRDWTETHPDLDSVVACTVPHIYEVTGVIELPVGWIDPSGTVEQIEAQRSALTTEGGALFDDYYDFAGDQCAHMATVAAGIERPLAGVAATASGLRPSGSFWIDMSVAPADRIAATGSAQLICAIGFWDEYGDTIKIASPTERAMILDFLSPNLPLEFRECVVYEPDGAYVENCAEAHWAETFAEFNAVGVIDQAIVDRMRAVMAAGETTPPEDNTLLTQICQEAFGGLVDAGNPTTDVRIGGRVWVSWADYHPSYSPVWCVFVAADSANYDIAAGVGSRIGVATGGAEVVRIP